MQDVRQHCRHTDWVHVLIIEQRPLKPSVPGSAVCMLAGRLLDVCQIWITGQLLSSHA
jgi:hypothetical protein